MPAEVLKPSEQGPYVVVQIGAMKIGVPVESVLQALPVSASMTKLPRRDGAIAGVASYGDLTIPVIDLSRWVEVGTAAVEQHGLHAKRILVLQDEGRTAGVLVDAVIGVITVQEESVTRVCHGDSSEEVFHSIARHEEDILSLLDTSQLIKLCDIWGNIGRSGGTASETTSTNAAREQKRTAMYAFFARGEKRFALAARHIGEVVPMPVRQIIGAHTGANFCTWRGRHIPVSDLPGLKDGNGIVPCPLLLILTHNDLAVGIPVGEVLRVSEMEIAFDSNRSSASECLLATTIDDDGRPISVFDAARFIDTLPEAKISRKPIQDIGIAAQKASVLNPRPYIVFESDHPLCVSIDTVLEVLPTPSDLHMNGIGDEATMSWRGKALTVIDRRERPDVLASKECHGALLVFNLNGMPIGMLVNRVQELVPANAGEISRIPLARDPSFSMLTVCHGNACSSYSIFNPASLHVRT